MRTARSGSRLYIVVNKMFSIFQVAITLVAHVPSLSHAAASQMCASARRAPASQLVRLPLLLTRDQKPVFKAVFIVAGSHIIPHEIVVMNSECCTGSYTLAMDAKRVNSSGAARWWCL